MSIATASPQGRKGRIRIFPYLFEPATGSVGDTLTLTVVSITNPDFQPDMESTSGYVWYHKCLEYRTQWQFNESVSPDIPFLVKATDVFSIFAIQCVESPAPNMIFPCLSIMTARTLP